MNKTIVLAVLMMLSTSLAGEELPGKKVSIGPENYSDIYPAVWFCPDDATFVPLKERSEIPPEARYRIWIEPSDPEFNTTPIEGSKGISHFIEIGTGEKTYKNATGSTPGKKVKRLGSSNFEQDKPVFIYAEKKKKWAFIILSTDRKKQTITFMWRKLDSD